MVWGVFNGALDFGADQCVFVYWGYRYDFSVYVRDKGKGIFSPLI